MAPKETWEEAARVLMGTSPVAKTCTSTEHRKLGRDQVLTLPWKMSISAHAGTTGMMSR